MSGVILDNYPASAVLLPAGRIYLSGISDFDYRRYDNTYADSDAPTVYGCPYSIAAYGHHSGPIVAIRQTENVNMGSVSNQ